MNPTEVVSQVDAVLNKAGQLTTTIHTANDNVRLKQLLTDRISKAKVISQMIKEKTDSIHEKLGTEHYTAAKNFADCMIKIQEALALINDASRGDRWIKDPATYAKLYKDLLTGLRTEFFNFCSVYVNILKKENKITDAEVEGIDAYFIHCGYAQELLDMVQMLTDMQQGIEAELHVEESKKGTAAPEVQREIQALQQDEQNLKTLIAQFTEMQKGFQANPVSLPPQITMKGNSHIGKIISSGITMGGVNISGSTEEIIEYMKEIGLGVPDENLIKRYHTLIANMPKTQEPARPLLAMEGNAYAGTIEKRGDQIAPVNLMFENGKSKPPENLTADQSMVIAVHAVKTLWSPTMGNSIALEPFDRDWPNPKKNKWLLNNTKLLVEAYEDDATMKPHQNLTSFADAWAALEALKNISLSKAHSKTLVEHYERETNEFSAQATHSSVNANPGGGNFG